MIFDPTQVAAGTAESKRGRKAKPVENGEPVATLPPTVVAIEVPLDGCVPGNCSRHFDFRATPRQAAAARVLLSSLSDRGERFQVGNSFHPGGKVVDGNTEAIRWLLDRLADAIESETGKQLAADFGLSFV